MGRRGGRDDHANPNSRTTSAAAMKIAADICIYTNHTLTIEELS